MTRILGGLFLLVSLSPPLAAETFDGYLIDIMCSAKLASAGPAAAQYHTKDCALSENCKASGYGVAIADGTFLKLDEEGNSMAVKALEAASKPQDLKVSVDGELQGDTIAVKSVQLL